MAGIYNGPSRGGTRGGKDQFQWEDVKEDKQGQNYLGHSVKAAHGRWQKNKDLNWAWKKSKLDLQAAGKSELQMAKERDADLMAQMLGEKPMQRPEADLARTEKNRLFKKGDAEEGTVAEAIAGDKFGERIEGLGFAPIKIDNLAEKLDVMTHERQEGFASDLLKAHAASNEEMEEAPGGGGDEADGVDYAALLAGIEDGGGGGSSRSLEKMDKKVKKEIKKAMKQEKKRLKAEKKDSKKEKKEKKEKQSKGSDAGGSKRHDSDSSDSEADTKNPRQLELEQRHREWGGGGGGNGGRRERSRSPQRSERERSRERDRQRDRSRDRDRERDRGRESRRDRSRDGGRDRSRDRGR